MRAGATMERLARRFLPPRLARLAKRAAVRPRYWAQRRACRRGFRAFGDRYPQKILFIAGLPKSGTTWLERMVSSYEGFHDLLIPDVAAHELATGGSHDYELPADLFDRFRNMLVLTKMHVHGSPHNVAVLARARVPYVVLFRDLRDVAVSNFFYVRRTPWHPEYPRYRERSVEDGLAVFADCTLAAYEQWVRSWHDHLDSELGLIVRYEDMLADTIGEMTRVARHFQLDDAPETIQRIVEQHRFERLAPGRAPGQHSDRSFFRKGVAGDWRNHFTPDLCALYREKIGAFLVEYGYEQDCAW